MIFLTATCSFTSKGFFGGGIFGLVFSADSSLLISDFESQQPSAEAGTEDEFDPIPVTGRKNSQGMSLHCPLGSIGWERWCQKKQTALVFTALFYTLSQS